MSNKKSHWSYDYLILHRKHIFIYIMVHFCDLKLNSSGIIPVAHSFIFEATNNLRLQRIIPHRIHRHCNILNAQGKSNSSYMNMIAEDDKIRWML